jgi:hypothetical protein
MSTSSTGPPPPAHMTPAPPDVALRDIKILILEALESEWHRANQAGNESGDYRRRDPIQALGERVRKWEPAAPSGGPARGGEARKGFEARPPAVERADRLIQMLADIPELDDVLKSTGLVQKVMEDARAAQERRSQSQPSSRWRNPFSAAALLRSGGPGNFPRSRTSASPGGPGQQGPRKIVKRR